MENRKSAFGNMHCVQSEDFWNSLLTAVYIEVVFLWF